VQVLNFQNNQVQNSTGIGLWIDAAGLTRLDALLTGNNISNSFFAGVNVSTEGGAVVRVTAISNTISGNVSPVQNPLIGAALDDGGVSLQSNGGGVTPSRIIASFENNDISFNGQSHNPGGTPVSGIAAHTSGTGVMALQVFGNRIIGNGQSGVNLIATNQIAPAAPFSASIAAEIRDNVMDITRTTGNAGTTAVQALVNQETPPNQSIIFVELTHNESNKPFVFTNTSTTPVPTGLIGVEDDGLNTASINFLGGGLFASLPQGTVAAAIAPMLIFP
jgi:hypothetical protein